MRFPRRETLLAIAAVAAIPFSASAQSDSQAQTPANRALSTLGSSLSGPELPASQPATPQRLQLMHRYLTDAEVDRVMKSFAELHYSKLQAQVAASIKGLPVNQQDLTLKAFKSAFDVAERRRESATLDEMERYYATRLTDDELETAVNFYAQGIGYKSLHDAQHMTLEDRQAAGQFMVDHPAMMKFAKLNFDYMKSMATRQPLMEQTFNEDLKGQFCRNLAASHLMMSTCLGAPQRRSPSG